MFLESTCIPSAACISSIVAAPAVQLPEGGETVHDHVSDSVPTEPEPEFMAFPLAMLLMLTTYAFPVGPVPPVATFELRGRLMFARGVVIFHGVANASIVPSSSTRANETTDLSNLQYVLSPNSPTLKGIEGLGTIPRPDGAPDLCMDIVRDGSRVTVAEKNVDTTRMVACRSQNGGLNTRLVPATWLFRCQHMIV